jgi:hypothetical protein
MEWKYIKSFEEKSINDFEKLTKFLFPQTFKNCIKQHNGGRPKCRLFDTINTSKRGIKRFLSFNPQDKESIWNIYKCNELNFCNKYIPFAIDNFGNLICFNYNSQIIFVNHETLQEEFVASNFDDFMNNLYIDANYFKDTDNGNIVRQVFGYCIEYLEKGTNTWIDCTPSCVKDSNYAREIYLGEGWGCLIQISEEEYFDILNQWHLET